MRDIDHPHTSRWLSLLAVFAGAAGMAASFQFLASASLANLPAGMAGFVAGAVLIGSGLIALAMLARPDVRQRAAEPRTDDTHLSTTSTVA